MKVFLVIDETNFYQPDFVADLVRNKHYNFVGCALVTKVSDKSNIETYIRRNWYFMSFPEIFKLGVRKIIFKCLEFFGSKNENGNFYSVRSVLKYFNVSYFEVEYNINRQEYISRIQRAAPDVIVSSNSMIFGTRILESAKFCINRHSALLPSYGGLWPVFHAYAQGEEKVGVSIHLMEKEIDKGMVLAQQEIVIKNTDTIDTLYQKCFKVSALLVIDALVAIEKGTFDDIVSKITNCTPSYFSFPDKDTWVKFRARGGRFI